MRGPLPWLLAVSLAVPGAAGAVGFFADREADVRPGAVDLRGGDVDGDGRAEAVLAIAFPGDPLAGRLAVHWNQGGQLAGQAGATELMCGFDPASVAVIDLNGDGRGDVAVAGQAEDTQLLVFLALPGRAFAPPVSYPLPAGSPPGTRQLVAVDLTGGAEPELVVAERQSLVLFDNRGDGSFAPGRLAGNPAVEVVALLGGPLDAQPGLDVLLVGADRIQTWASSGATLVPRPALVTGRAEQDVQLLDLDRDGVLDVASVLPGAIPGGPGTVQVYRNSGSGEFSSGRAYPVPPAPTRSRRWDVNGDGVDDLVVASGSALTVLYGDGAMGFTRRHDRPGGSAPLLDLADLDGDGDAGDPVRLAGGGPDQVAQAVSAGVFVSLPPDSYPLPHRLLRADTGDLDGDGHLDAAVVSEVAEVATLLVNDGSGRFVAGDTLPLGEPPVAVAVGDTGGDGWPDLLVLVDAARTGARHAASAPGKLLLFPNLGGGTFGPPASFAVGQGPLDLVSGDLDRDGRSDAVTADAAGRSVTVLYASGAGFSSHPIPVDLKPVALAIRDLDGDGDLDLAVAGIEGGAGVVQVLRNDEDRGIRDLTPLASFSVGQGPVDIASVDLEADGLPELVVAEGTGLVLRRLDNLGGLRFAPGAAWALPGAPTAVSGGYLNCDPAEDVLVTVETSAPQRLLAFLSEGDGELAPPQSLPAGAGARGVLAADLDHMGSEDALVVATGTDEVQVTRNVACDGPGACTAQGLSFAAPPTVCPGTLLRLVATPGFARYRWSDGQRGAERALLLLVPGTRSIGLEAWDATGCVARAQHTVRVLEPPAVSLDLGDQWRCASDQEILLEVKAVTATGMGGPVSLSWQVDPPGSILEPGGRTTAVRFPPLTPPGAYRVTARASEQGGCEARASLELLVLADEPAVFPGSIRLSRAAGQGVRVSWTRSHAERYDVLLAASPRALAEAPVEVGVGLAADEFEHVPPPGSLWYYGVRLSSPCGTMSGQ